MLRSLGDELNVTPISSGPDMSVLNAGRRDPVPMPSDLFGGAWGLLQLIAHGTATPVDYSAIGYLTSCASLIGGKRKVKPFADGNWTEPCILWAGVVGDPSSRKSPALDMVTDRLRNLERDAAESHKDKLRDWETESERAKIERTNWQSSVKDAAEKGFPTPQMPTAADFPDEPIRRRTMVMDTTPEAIGAILSGNPEGTLHFRDELAGWLTGFDRYSPGGREFWLEAYGGRPFSIDRKGAKEPLVIPFNGISVLGGIQPAKMADAMLAHSDDGLVARFLWAWPDKAPWARPRSPANLDTLEGIYRRLDELPWRQDADGNQCPGIIPLSPAAEDVFAAWAKENSETDEDASGLIKSFVGKMDGTVLRLALVAELSAWAINGGDEPAEISSGSIEAAALFVDDYAKPMAERVYGDAALPRSERNAALLARYIIKKQLRSINKRELKQSPHKSALRTIRDAAAMNDALEILCDAGWLSDIGEREGGSAGRKRGDYSVNPAVLGAGK